MRVKFVKSPTAAFKLAYSAGEEADVKKTLGEELIADGYAIEVKSKAKPKSKPKAKPDKTEPTTENTPATKEAGNADKDQDIHSAPTK